MREEASTGDSDCGDSAGGGWGVGQFGKEGGGTFPILEPLMTGRAIRPSGEWPQGRSIGPPSEEDGGKEANGVRSRLKGVQGGIEIRLGSDERGAGGGGHFGLLV